MGLADPRRWPRPWTGDRGGRLRCPGAQRQVLASRSQDVSSALHVASGETLPRFLPQEATVGPRAPAKGHDFPRGAGAPASVLPAGTSIWGRRGSGQGGGFFYEFPLVCLSFLCMLYPLPILPFSSLCHQKLPAALWARSAPPGGPTPVWMLDKRLWPFRDTGLASPGRRQSKPIGTPPAL